MKPQTFASLPIKTLFKFVVFGGSNNPTMEKISATEYQGDGFTAKPKPNVLVVRQNE